MVCPHMVLRVGTCFSSIDWIYGPTNEMMVRVGECQKNGGPIIPKVGK